MTVDCNSGGMTVRINLKESDNVLIIATAEGDHAFTGVGRVEMLAPFIVRLLYPSDKEVPSFVGGSSVTLLIDQNGDTLRTNATVQKSEHKRSAVYLELEMGKFQKLERRRCERFSTTIPVNVVLAAILSGTTEFARSPGLIIDISATGAWLQTDVTLEKGWLVHIEGKLPNQEPFKALAEIVRVNKNGDKRDFAVDFVDFFGQSKQNLQRFLAAEAREVA